MRRIYLDNAATSFPKPPEVWDAVLRYATQNGSSPGRGQYAQSGEGAGIIRRCRERLATLLHDGDASAARHARNVIFTLNTSDALNLAIKGVVRQARLTRGATRPIRLVTTSMDHNSVLRPFAALAEEGARVEHVAGDSRTGVVSEKELERVLAMGDAPTLVAINWVSNVSGTIQPIEGLARVARASGAAVLIDAAQGLGHLPIDVGTLDADLVAFPGHKGLLGPQGTGGLWIRPGFEESLATTREGGTGSIAELDAQPTSMPERFEAGSHNTPGIAGLSEGVAWLLAQSVSRLREHEETLIERFVRGVSSAGASFTGDGIARVDGPLRGLRGLGPSSTSSRVGTFSLVHESLSPADLAALLEQVANIQARAGIHCAPLAHQTLGTLDHASGRGAVRVSFGPFVTERDIDTLLDALREICADVCADGGGNQPRTIPCQSS